MPSGSAPGPVRLTARGHPGVTARHAKTLELTTATEITARASCVVGVAATLPPELASLRGTVRLDLAVGGLSTSVTGEVNPAYVPGDALIVRRSDVLDPDTFLVNASGVAADLPRELVAALGDPAAVVSVTATETGTPDPVVLVLGAGPATPETAALAASAEVVVDLTGPGAPPPVPPPGRRMHGWPASLEGVRTVVVLGAPAVVPLDLLPRRRVVTWPPAYPGAELLLAAGVPAAPVLQGGALPGRADALRALAAVPYPVVLGTAGDGLGALRAAVPGRTVLLPDPALGWGTGAVSVPPGAEPDPAGLRRAPALVLLPPAGEPHPLGTDAGALARLLRGAGVSGRTVAGVLTALGVPRKEAYDLATRGDAPVDIHRGPDPGPR
ncbi:MAG TPA: DUF371 domain-containing protein [Mycobacteriales bacterium]